MADRLEAYDLSMFEPRYDNAVPARERPQREPRRRENVVELPQKELEKNAKPKRHPFRAMAMTIGFAVAITIATAMVYSQEQLALLTEEINTATQELEESQSLEVQLSMQAAQKMNGSQVEQYAAGVLGMSKADNRQVTYVNVAQRDEGTVVQSTEGGSFLDKLLSAIRSLFA